ncbi:MAG: hypothetical protein ACJA2S_004964 [Cyclobacteriaceae bacterium]|jgi:hypothetical protein
MLLFGLSLKAQTIDIETIKINNSITYNSDISSIKATFSIDSIVSIPELMDMSLADSLIYIGQSYFEYYTVTQKCLINVIFFDSKIRSFSVGDNMLNKQTTLKDIQNMFPNNCKMTSETSIYGNISKFETCDINLTDKDGNLIDMKLIFFFSQGLLKRIDIWEPS